MLNAHTHLRPPFDNGRAKALAWNMRTHDQCARGNARATLVQLLGAFALAASPIIPLALWSPPALAQQAKPLPDNFQLQAEGIVRAAFPIDGPGAAVIVTRGGKVVYVGGQGLADVEARRPITPETAFPLGSIVKQFTASVILQLVDEGKVSLDDPISHFFPDWPQPGANATIRQLLNHTSGIQDFAKIPGWSARNRIVPHTTEELVALSRSLPAKSEPGRAWEYNNGGYVMLGAIIEEVTGKAWHEAIAERITDPLGLETIHTVPDEVTSATVRGYKWRDGEQRSVQFSHPSVAHAAGGLVGSVIDLARWANALHHGRIVSAELYQEMIRPARLANGSSRPYGFGMRLQKIRGRRALAHGGSGSGLDTDTIYIPSEDLFVAVLANSEDPATDPDTLTYRLAALALGEPFPTFSRADVDVAAIEPLFGSYDLERGPPFRFFARGDRLYLGRGDDQKEVFAAGEDRFFFGPDDLMWFRIVRQTDGAHVMELNLPSSKAPERAIRTGALPPPFTLAPDVLRTYVGTYQSEGIPVTVALGENGSLTITRAGDRPLSLRPVSETEFRIDGTPMRLVFHFENGVADRFTLYRGARKFHGTRTGR